MNIAMEQTEEYDDGQLKAKYGDCFIRGNNGALSIGVCCVCGQSVPVLTTLVLSSLLVCNSLVHFGAETQIDKSPTT